MRTGARISILWIVLIASNIYAVSALQKPEKHLLRCPASSESGIKIFNRIAYQSRAKENAIDNIISETADNNIEQMQAGLNIIEINSDITTNQIWTANNEYHITDNVNVQALLVIEPGAVIYFDYYGGLIVNNGGALISAGTPNNPITYTSEDGYGSGDYYCAIEVQETASPATKIIYSNIEFASIAILTENIRLDTPIQNNYLFYNILGIREYGTCHTDIINNLIYYSFNDYYYTCAIEIYMESEAGVGNAESSILIENNTCDYQDFGIIVHGTEDENDIGLTRLVNNIISESAECGLNLVDGYMYAIVSNTGYYYNYENNNGGIDEDNPVEATENPFDEAGWRLVDGCPFIDAGLEYVEETSLIGTTTNLNSMPDSNIIDIGYHYSNWNYSNAGTTTLQADFDNNLRVDYNDLAFFADFWLFDYDEAYKVWWWDYDSSGRVDYGDLMVVAEYWLSPFDFIDFADFARQWRKEVDGRLYDSRADLNKDDIVNFEDFAILANEWQQTAEGNPAISVSVSGDVNNLKGEIGVSIGGCPYSTSTAFIFMDGQLMGETDYKADEGNPGITINTPSHLNGNHLLKAAIIDHNGLITVSENLAVDFNNPLHCLSINDTYEPNKPMRLLGLSETENNLQVKLSKWDETMIWSQETSGNLDINIPGNVLAGQIYDLSIEQEIGGLELLDLRLSDSNSLDFDLLNSDSLWEPVWERAVAARYNPDEPYQFAIILPTAWDYFPYPEDSAKSRKRAVAAIVSSCETMAIPYIILYKDNCTWENFAQVLSKPTVCYVYVVSRGASSLPGEYVDQRTYFKLSERHKVVSYLDISEPLGGGWDNNTKVHSMASLGFGGTDKFKIVWIDVCLNGLYGDMAAAWMEFDFPTFDKLYISWNSLIQTSNDSDFCSWTTFFWGDPDGFGLYGANTYYQAFTRAQIEVNNGTWISGKVAAFGDLNIRFINMD